MEEKIVDLKTATLAKILGFHVLVGRSYKENTTPSIIGSSTNKEEGVISAPTQSLLQKWLREEHDIIVTIDVYQNTFGGVIKCNLKRSIFAIETTDTWEEALENGLTKGLNLIDKEL